MLEISAGAPPLKFSCYEDKPESCGIIIFGASGDLTHRKLVPALFNLFERDLLPDSMFILGCGRTKLTDTVFRDSIHTNLSPKENPALKKIKRFATRFYYTSGDYHDDTLYSSLLQRIMAFGSKKKYCNHIFYLATPPVLYGSIIERLGSAGILSYLVKHPSSVRVVIEKPFGYDLNSALKLDGDIHRVLSENQIYRIDHYLGKETVQNILMFRFANAVFEPIWNRRYIDNIQITVSETIGVEHRAGYFEHAGLLRDMFQNHMLQMLALVAMEPPASFDPDRVRDEKVKLLRAVRPFPLEELDHWIVRGQYGTGTSGSEKLPGYRQEKGIDPDSQAETFVAAKLMVDNWRWQGVPFYLRSGKRLPMRVSEIAIVFKEVPHSLFTNIPPGTLAQNILVLTVQPDEGVSLRIQAKSPGPKLCMSKLSLDFNYHDVFGLDPPDAYERLLMDCMLGDQTLFIRRDDMEVAWSLITPVLQAWHDNPDSSPLYFYPSGSWGPMESQTLLELSGHYWRFPEKTGE